MSSGNGLDAYFVVTGVGLFVVGVYTLLRSDKIAEKNKALIESGKETYFEERRSWKAYGTEPKTEPKLVRRNGLLLIGVGLLQLVAAALSYFY